MKGDFSRATFDSAKHFSRVLMQQGRVQLDADWNEQIAILWHYMRNAIRDALGSWHWAPKEGHFKITANGNSFQIGLGHYYVDGIMCETLFKLDATGKPIPLPYEDQLDYPEPDKLSGGCKLVYLDVWERHITCVEDDYIREKALDGPDTASRAKVVWQVKVQDSLSNTATREYVHEHWDDEFIPKWQPANRGLLKARAQIAQPGEITEACLIPPESRYRGAENQLYRVEIYKGGVAQTASFKWSRDNGCVIFPVRTLHESVAIVEHLGRDERTTLKIGDLVEVADDHKVLKAEPGTLARVKDIKDLSVKLEKVDVELPDYDEEDNIKHPLLRRWEGFQAINEISAGSEDWSTLEDGIQIQFRSSKPSHNYRTGDYWLIPARTATGDVEWPQKDADGNPVARPPDGIMHHYAPLAIVKLVNNILTVVHCCRRKPNGEFWHKIT